MNIESKYIASLKLAAIGDALGWMTEFEKSKQSLENKFKTDFIDTFYDWEKSVGGRFHGYVDKLEPGSYSDDTQLLLSVARSIKNDGTVDQNYFAKNELTDWLLYSRGAGRTIKNAARKIQRKSADWNNNFFTFKVGKTTIDYRESGANGAAMRILPIALANFDKSEVIKEEIFCNSIVTHGHPRAILGAMLYGYSIDCILKIIPENFNFTSFLTELGKDMHDKFSIDFIENKQLQKWEAEWNKKSKLSFKELFKAVINETQEFLRKIYKMLANNVSDFEVLKSIGCYQNETKGSGTSTVLAGIYFVCRYANNPIKSIEKAVNSIGTDTDSIAAFAGGLMGALHGESVIPSKWKSVQDTDYINHVAIRLLEISECRANLQKQTEKENAKNISEVDSDSYVVNERVFLETLGGGIVKSIDRQKPLTKGKYNLILDVQFDIGQFCRFAKLLNIEEIKNDVYFEASNKEFASINNLNLDENTKKQVENFMRTINTEQQKELYEILSLLKK